MRAAILLAGPTASGKSALAVALAKRLNGVVINADSMQVYRELRVLTARPSAAEEALVPHALYGVRSAAEPGSVAWWRGEALAAMEGAWAEGRLPILCGGTGMYFAALAGGLAEVPGIPAEARAEARGLLAGLGAEGLHRRLAEVDPETAGRVRPSDGQRVARAWEVWRGTGRGLAEWVGRGDTGRSLLRCARNDRGYLGILIDPPRDRLRAAIADRFAGMLARGAMEEVRGLVAMGLDSALPAMRAHGVPELAGYLRGEISLEEASRRAVLATGRYTKRQATWFRHHPLSERMHTIHARIDGQTKEYSEILLKVFDFVRAES